MTMNDQEVYETYKDYKASIHILTPQSGIVDFEFPNRENPKETIGFIIYSTGTIVFNKGLPEFIYKEVTDEIRQRLDDSDQYLWGV